VTSEANAVVYSVLLRGWLVFGDGEVWARTFSLLTAVATVPAIYLLGRKLLGVKAGVIAAFLFPLNFYFINFAQESRGYPLAVLLGTLASLLAAATVMDETKSSRTLYSYAVVATLAVATHLFNVLVVLSHLCSLVFAPKKARFRLIVAAVPSLVVTTLIGVVHLNRAAGGEYRRGAPSLLDLAGVIKLVSGQANVVAYFLLSGFAVFLLVQARRRNAATFWPLAFIFLLFVFPMASAWLGSQFRPLFNPRYMVVALPGLVLLVAAGVAALPRLPAIAAGAVIVMLAVPPLAGSYSMPRQDWRGVVEYLAANGTENDRVVIHPYVLRQPYDYYADERMPGTPPVAYPAPDRTYAISELIGDVAAGDTAPERVWLAVGQISSTESVGQLDALEDALSLRYVRAGTRGFAEITVVLYEKEPQSSGR